MRPHGTIPAGDQGRGDGRSGGPGVIDLCVPTGPSPAEPLPPPIDFNAGSGLGREATEWLLDRGIRVIGTDAWGLDRPFIDVRAAFVRDRDASRIWEAHRVGIGREYCQIEKLHNLGALPGPSGYTVSCLPVKVAGASAGWCRAAAILP